MVVFLTLTSLTEAFDWEQSKQLTQCLFLRIQGASAVESPCVFMPVISHNGFFSLFFFFLPFYIHWSMHWQIFWTYWYWHRVWLSLSVEFGIRSSRAILWPNGLYWICIHSTRILEYTYSNILFKLICNQHYNLFVELLKGLSLYGACKKLSTHI